EGVCGIDRPARGAAPREPRAHRLGERRRLVDAQPVQHHRASLRVDGKRHRLHAAEGAFVGAGRHLHRGVDPLRLHLERLVGLRRARVEQLARELGMAVGGTRPEARREERERALEVGRVEE
ncbi:MAG: hypothetical protein ACK55I_00835, partial [bacterium]